MRRSRAASLLVGALLLAPAIPAHAQSSGDPAAPVPPDPEGAERPQPERRREPRARRPVAPGFEESDAAPADAPEDDDEEPEERPRKRARSRRADAEEEDDEAGRRPVEVPEPGRNEQLIAEMNAATGEVSLGELIDEILGDVVAEIDSRPTKWFSPMAIRQVSLGANVLPSYGKKLQSTIIAQIHAGTRVRMVQCVECEATRTSLVDKQWVITRGVVTTEEMRSIGDKIGVKSFMDVAFGFDPESGVLEMDFRIIRASDAKILWADAFRADDTTPLLMRSSEAPMKRKDRMRDLEMLLEGRPLYGYVASAGFMILPHNDPVEGDISGATAGYRIYERFGAERRVMFGLDLTGFLNTSRLAGAVISAGSWWVPLRPDLVNPELRLGAKAGAFIAGTAGNAAVFQLGAEVLLRYRFGLYAYVLFMTKSAFPPDSETELGGVGMSTGMSFNW